jgi:RimJ/RimL family protein N-acetyltransferase
MILRPATLEDAQRLHAWRNDPETCANSHNTDPVPWADHVAWLERSLASASRQLFVAEADGVPVATCRADESESGIELSWTVAPAARGHGIGYELVRLLVQRFHLHPLRAEVKTSNVASQKIALAAGFRLDHEAGGVIHFQLP